MSARFPDDAPTLYHPVSAKWWREYCEAFPITEQIAGGWSKGVASSDWRELPPTPKQLAFLKRSRAVGSPSTRGQASDMIGEIVKREQERESRQEQEEELEREEREEWTPEDRALCREYD